MIHWKFLIDKIPRLYSVRLYSCICFLNLPVGSGMYTPGYCSFADPLFLLYTGSGIRIYHPGSRIIKILVPGSGSASKNLNIFNPKKNVSKLSEKWSGMFVPDPDFFPIPDSDPVSRGQKITGSRIRNTAGERTVPVFIRLLNVSCSCPNRHFNCWDFFYSKLYV